MKCTVVYSTPDKPDFSYSVVYDNLRSRLSVFCKIRSELRFRERLGFSITNFSVTYENFDG